MALSAAVAPVRSSCLIQIVHWSIQHRARIQAVRFRLEDVSIPALLSLMPGPRSYTGEDSFELQFPGHPSLLHRVVNNLLKGCTSLGLNVALPARVNSRLVRSCRVA